MVGEYVRIDGIAVEHDKRIRQLSSATERLNDGKTHGDCIRLSVVVFCKLQKRLLRCRKVANVRKPIHNYFIVTFCESLAHRAHFSLANNTHVIKSSLRQVSDLLLVAFLKLRRVEVMRR